MVDPVKKRTRRTLRICLWSGPRNVSTALMYSFAQRSDTIVLDEPLYAHYLRVSGASHPDREAILETMENDGRRVVEQVILGNVDKRVLFQKHMAHHLVDLDLDFLKQTFNVFLVRAPELMLPSLAKVIGRPQLKDTGLGIQSDLLRKLRRWGQDPPVLDSRELLQDPPGVLRRLCETAGLDFQESMLTWPAQQRPEDGVWAPHWYDNVHRSVGFQPYRPRSRPLPAELAPLLEECRPHYEFLLESAIRAQ